MHFQVEYFDLSFPFEIFGFNQLSYTTLATACSSSRSNTLSLRSWPILSQTAASRYWLLSFIKKLKILLTFLFAFPSLPPGILQTVQRTNKSRELEQWQQRYTCVNSCFIAEMCRGADKPGGCLAKQRGSRGAAERQQKGSRRTRICEGTDQRSLQRSRSKEPADLPKLQKKNAKQTAARTYFVASTRVDL